jgi:hypothetical protein
VLAVAEDDGRLIPNERLLSLCMTFLHIGLSHDLYKK